MNQTTDSIGVIPARDLDSIRNLLTMVRSSVGELPATPSSTRQSAAHSGPRPERQAPDGRLALVVESDPLQRKVIARMLEKEGYSVNTATCSAEAITTFQSCAYGIVLIDCDDAQVDGLELAATMRRLEQGDQRTTIIALTSNSTQGHRKKRTAAGIDSYISRPIRRETVQAVLAPFKRTSTPSVAPRLATVDRQILSELRELSGDDAGIVRELIGLFMASTPAHLDEMRSALDAGDAERLGRVAHTLKGSSGQMGVRRMQEICATIETLARAGSLAGIDSLLPELSLAFQRAGSDLYLADIPAQTGGAGPGGNGATDSAEVSVASKTTEVLLAEDDALTARFLTNSLTGAGFPVTHCSDGQAALEAIRSKAFRVVILDISMPKLDGYGVLSQLRICPGRETTPVLMLSSRHQEPDVLRAFDLGVDDYMTKPFNPLEVVARVRRLAKRR